MASHYTCNLEFIKCSPCASLDLLVYTWIIVREITEFIFLIPIKVYCVDRSSPKIQKYGNYMLLVLIYGS